MNVYFIVFVYILLRFITFKLKIYTFLNNYTPWSYNFNSFYNSRKTNYPLIISYFLLSFNWMETFGRLNLTFFVYLIVWIVKPCFYQQFESITCINHYSKAYLFTKSCLGWGLQLNKKLIFNNGKPKTSVCCQK